MKLKCFGGKNNGYFHEVENYYKNGDMIRINLPNEYSIPEFVNPADASTIVENYEYYKIEIVAYNKQKWKILLHIELQINSFMIGLFEGMFGQPTYEP